MTKQEHERELMIQYKKVEANMDMAVKFFDFDVATHYIKIMEVLWQEILETREEKNER